MKKREPVCVKKLGCPSARLDWQNLKCLYSSAGIRSAPQQLAFLFFVWNFLKPRRNQDYRDDPGALSFPGCISEHNAILSELKRSQENEAFSVSIALFFFPLFILVLTNSSHSLLSSHLTYKDGGGPQQTEDKIN